MSTTAAFRACVAALAIVAGGIAVAVYPTEIAFAHDSLIDTTPADGEHTELPPTEVGMTFTEPVLTIGATINVVDSLGKNWAAGDVVFDGQSVVQPLEAELPAGDYSVVWQVASSDGHVISGTYGFSTGDISTVTPVTENPPATSTPSPPEASAASADDGGTGISLWLAGILGATVGTALYAAVILVRRRIARP